MHSYMQWPLVVFNIRPMYLRYFFKGAMHDSSEVFRKKLWRIKLLPFSFIATKIFFRFHSRTPTILLLLWYAWSHLVRKFVFWKVCVFLKKDFSSLFLQSGEIFNHLLHIITETRSGCLYNENLKPQFSLTVEHVIGKKTLWTGTMTSFCFVTHEKNKSIFPSTFLKNSLHFLNSLFIRLYRDF